MAASGYRPDRPRRSRGAIVAVALLGLTAWIASTILAFEIGFLDGLALGGGALVVYMIPATIYDWPRITWDHISACLAAITGFFASIFGW